MGLLSTVCMSNSPKCLNANCYVFIKTKLYFPSFLLERNSWTELEDLTTMNKFAMSTLEAQDSEL